MSPRIFSLICSMISIAFLWPSEGAIDGDGLLWVFGWAVVATLVAVCGTPFGSRVSLRIVVPVMLLIGGFWVSTWHVFQVQGDRRAALNLAFEWTAIGLAFWCVLRLPQQHLRQIPALIVAFGVGVSVMAILQYHVANDRLADWYRSQISVLDSSSSPVERQAVEAEFERQGIPVDAGRRELFERRLLASSEPTGPFALANTLGGVVAVVLVFLVAGILHRTSLPTAMGIWSWFVAGLLIAVVGYCLVLTKSRTAWVGVVAGVMYLFGRRLNARSWMKRGAVLIGFGLLAGFAGVASGAIDREVLLESPKSLQYRLFYWTGASGVIGESPFFGAGPGNFRQSYLAYKVPESSEEILDPHNAFFDAWCSAGLIGFVGLVWMTIAAVSSDVPLKDDSKDGDSSLSSTSTKSSGVLKGIVFGSLIYFAQVWLGGTPLFDVQEIFRSSNLLLLVPTCAAIVTVWALPTFSPPVPSASAAFVCLMVHLLGAGGLQITIMGLLMVVCYGVAMARPSDDALTPSPLPSHAKTALFLAAAIAIIWFGVKPNMIRQHHLEIASFRKSMGNKTAALVSFESAIAADPLSVDSRQHKAEFLTYELGRKVERYALNSDATGRSGAFEEDFSQCAEAIEEFIQSDRRRVQGYYLRSQLFRMLPVTGLKRSIEDLDRVVEIYPTNVQAWAELAFLRQQANDPAASLARDTALHLEAVNQEWGHIDRYLNDDVVGRLKAISGL